MKEMLKNDPNFTELTDKQIDALTEGEAIAATQAAIWTYANGSSRVDSESMGNQVHVGENGNLAVKDATAEVTAAISAVYRYLITLTEKQTKENTTEIINKDNYISDVTMTVGERVAGEANNEDEDDTNDVYEVELNFTMEVTPDQQKDDLVLTLVDENENVIARARIAGEPEEDETWDILHPTNGNTYTLKCGPMAENVNVNFTLLLSGKQSLENGVYIYTANGGYKTSQSFVGIANGTKTVDVGMDFGFSFNVEESARTVERRSWFEEDPVVSNPIDPPVNPQDPPVEEIDDPEVPLDELPEEDVPLTEILDEEVPLANVPMTGDCSLLFIGMSILSGTGLAGLALTKKREE